MRPSPPSDWPVVSFATLDSTSDEARRRAVAGGCVYPFVIHASRQTKGRGRGSNTWWSSEGSLLFTLAIDPAATRIEPHHEPRLALIAALAVVDALPLLGAGIRWPNDVEVGGRKLAGVLPERVETDQGVKILIGVGVNVSTRFDSAPDEVRRLATSVLEADPRSSHDPHLMGRILDGFDQNLKLLVSESPALVDRWNAVDSLSGRDIQVRQGDSIVSGVGRGIDREGGLIIQTLTGLTVVYGGHVLRN